MINLHYLTKNEMKQISGGINITGALLQNLLSFFKMFYDLGNSLGTALKKIQNGNVC